MNQPTGDQRSEIERFLRSGDYDSRFSAWPGNTLVAQERSGRDALWQALIAAVMHRAEGRPIPNGLPIQDPIASTRGKVEPMVRGLFPANEQEQVLALLERSVVFLTPDTIRPVLEKMMWLHSAWDLANLYLGSLGADLLSDEAPQIVGMSVETTCYVSLEYFGDTSRFSDYVVHEAAHVFHNCKRRTAGLKETRRREWLLELEFKKRETFAYCCEAYSRIVAVAPRALGSRAVGRGTGQECDARRREDRSRGVHRDPARGRRSSEWLEADPCPLRPRSKENRKCPGELASRGPGCHRGRDGHLS